jgi:hypothetical protein
VEWRSGRLSGAWGCAGLRGRVARHRPSGSLPPACRPRFTTGGGLRAPRHQPFGRRSHAEAHGGALVQLEAHRASRRARKFASVCCWTTHLRVGGHGAHPWALLSRSRCSGSCTAACATGHKATGRHGTVSIAASPGSYWFRRAVRAAVSATRPPRHVRAHWPPAPRRIYCTNHDRSKKQAPQVEPRCSPEAAITGLSKA